MESCGVEENSVIFRFEKFDGSNGDGFELESSSQMESDNGYSPEDLSSLFSGSFCLSGNLPGRSNGFLDMGSEETGSEVLKTVSSCEHGHSLLERVSGSNQSGFGLSINSRCSEDLLDDWKAAPPHEALFFTLGYLPLRDLLRIGMVCKSLRDAVDEDSLLWQDICVKPPLSAKLTNEILLKLTAKAEGNLRSLALIECWKITDFGLQQVINSNPRIIKLYVPRCILLTPDGIVEAVKGLVERKGNLRHLKLRGLCNITKEHLESLYSLLDKNQQQQEQQPCLFYGNGARLSPLGGDDDRLIDIEICPKCGNARLVFDCTRKSCRERKERLVQCRGCSYCISRCEECGVCIDLQELGETFCMDFLCLECWLKLPKCLLCNRPGCQHHIGLQETSFGAAGFICESCCDFPSGSPV